MGGNPWEFILVTDQAVLQKLSRAKPHGAGFLKTRPSQSRFVPILKKAPFGLKTPPSLQPSSSLPLNPSVWEVAGFNCGNGCTTMKKPQGPTFQNCSKSLMGIVVECIIALGYPDESKAPHRKENLEYHKIHMGLYGKPFRK
jgi:hypothetical protein